MSSSATLDITRRDTLNKDRLEKTNQKTWHGQLKTTLNAARTSKSIFSWHITNQLFNIMQTGEIATQ